MTSRIKPCLQQICKRDGHLLMHCHMQFNARKPRQIFHDTASSVMCMRSFSMVINRTYRNKGARFRLKRVIGLKKPTTLLERKENHKKELLYFIKILRIFPLSFLQTISGPFVKIPRRWNMLMSFPLAAVISVLPKWRDRVFEESSMNLDISLQVSSTRKDSSPHDSMRKSSKHEPAQQPVHVFGRTQTPAIKQRKCE